MEKTKKQTGVYLDAETVELAKHLGGGNLSKGIRIAVKQQVLDYSVGYSIHQKLDDPSILAQIAPRQAAFCRLFQMCEKMLHKKAPDAQKWSNAETVYGTNGHPPSCLADIFVGEADPFFMHLARHCRVVNEARQICHGGYTLTADTQSKLLSAGMFFLAILTELDSRKVDHV